MEKSKFDRSNHPNRVDHRIGRVSFRLIRMKHRRTVPVDDRENAIVVEKNRMRARDNETMSIVDNRVMAIEIDWKNDHNDWHRDY